jgi:hypothetical protein
MSFREPLDDVQLQAAARQHAQMQRNPQELREHFRPRSRDQRELLKVYRDAIREFARALLKPRDKIDAERLNDLSRAVTHAFVRYRDARQ